MGHPDVKVSSSYFFPFLISFTFIVVLSCLRKFLLLYVYIFSIYISTYVAQNGEEKLMPIKVDIAQYFPSTRRVPYSTQRKFKKKEWNISKMIRTFGYANETRWKPGYVFQFIKVYINLNYTVLFFPRKKDFQDFGFFLMKEITENTRKFVRSKF